MKRRLSVFLLTAALFQSGVAVAGLSQYECQTKEWWKPDPSTGELKKKPVHPKSYAGTRWAVKPFLVDRNDGHVLGEYPFWLPRNPETTVLSQGSDKQSFVIVIAGAYAEGGRLVITLTIAESEKGSLKPFAALEGTSVYTGVCK